MNRLMHRLARIALASAVAAVALLGSAQGAAAQVSLVEYHTSAGWASPHHVTAPPGDPSRVLVVQAGGQIRLVKNGVPQATPFLDISSSVFGAGSCECGLFSMAFAPDYATSGLFYVFYTRDSEVSGEDHYLVLEEFERNPGGDTASLASRREVMAIPHLTASNHNGGQLHFGPDELLYISVGDGGNTPQLAQNLTTRLGKLLRIDPAGDAPGEYSIPAGNPFADGGGPNADEIYSYGLRNPWRFSFDRLTGDVMIGDVGAGAWEEIDFRRIGTARGANFGWRCYEGNHVAATSGECNPAPSNAIFPAIEYPNPVSGPAAVVGGYVVRDGALPSLLGRYVYADTFNALGGELWAANLGDSGATNNASLGLEASTVVSFGEDACAHLYVATLSPGQGRVFRLEPTEGAFPCDPQTGPAEPGEPGVAATSQQVGARPKPAARRARARWKRGKHRGRRSGLRRSR